MKLASIITTFESNQPQQHSLLTFLYTIPHVNTFHIYKISDSFCTVQAIMNINCMLLSETKQDQECVCRLR